MAAVRASGLVKRFETTCAVDGVDLVVAPGEVRGLLGPNGAGVLAGDLFASEDRHGTWKTVLTKPPRRRRSSASRACAMGTATGS